MSLTEILGFVTGAACVILAVRESAWNWPVGILNNIFFLLLFWHSKLYADAVLQVVYVVIAVYGWWNWIHGGADHGKLPVESIAAREWVAVCAASVIGTIVIRLALVRFTDSAVPTWDALTTTLSLVAQFMLGKKWIENWFFWIVADVIYIALYRYKALTLTAILYAVFLILCVTGWRRWSKSLDVKTVFVATETGA